MTAGCMAALFEFMGNEFSIRNGLIFQREGNTGRLSTLVWAMNLRDNGFLKYQWLAI